jgi:protein TonB
MKGALLVSVALHALAGICLFVKRPSLWPEPPEVPARIEVVFGHNALSEGAPAPAAAPIAKTPRAASAAQAVAPPPPSDTAMPHASAATARVSTAPAPSLAAASVRLGEGDIGFDVPQLDPGMVAAQADPGNRPPPYPRLAAARREQGSVLLRIHIGTDGSVTRIETLRGSGFAALDEAARNSALQWHFVPQLQDGEAVPSVRDQNFDFVLE